MEEETDYGSPVRLKGRTKKELRKYGQMGQSYDDLVWKLIKSYRLSLKLKRKESR
jgi:hypothetical protein